MPRLLLLCEYALLNGAERSMLATLDRVAAAGFVPTVAGPPAGPLAEALGARGVEVVAFSVVDDAGRRLAQNRLREELSQLLGRVKPDLLHANSLSMGRLSGPVAAQGDVPSIAHLRDIVRVSARAAADLNCHARLLAVSQNTRDFHAAALAADKLRVLYNGVDLEGFHPRPATGRLHRELGLPPETPLVATIGQIGPRKGQDVLVRAAALLAGQRPEARFVLVGRRCSEKAESRRFEVDLRDAASVLGDRIRFLGVRDDVDRLLNEVAVVAHPARQEPLGRVLLEAAASGVPVVATSVGGTGEIFPPGSARLVAPNDPTALAAAINELLGDGPLRAALAAAARRHAEAVFDLRKTSAALVEQYEQVTGRRRG